MAGMMEMARSTRAVSFGWRSAVSLEELEKSPREILHPEIQKGWVNFKFGVLCAKDGQLTDDEMFSNVFAGALLTQALGKTSFGFLLSHWELPNLVASGEIHPESVQSQLKLRESHLQFSQDTWRMGDVSEELGREGLSYPWRQTRCCPRRCRD